MTQSIIRQVIELSQKTPAQLRQIYNELMPEKCAANASREFLRPRIAYRLQELTFGGLKEEDKGHLLALANTQNTIQNNKNDNSERVNFLPGTKICRNWNGVNYQVEILKDGFEYQGQKFKSLSSIAGQITGTKWNGYKFFKLK